MLDCCCFFQSTVRAGIAGLMGPAVRCRGAEEAMEAFSEEICAGVLPRSVILRVVMSARQSCGLEGSLKGGLSRPGLWVWRNFWFTSSIDRDSVIRRERSAIVAFEEKV